MSIQIITGFSLNSLTPIDTRIVASGSSERDAIPYKYQGLRVFDLSNNRPYVYTGATWSSEVTDQISGTTGSISKFTSSNTVGDSNIYQVGANIGVNTSNPLASTQFGPYPVPSSGYSMPFTIHKSGGLAGSVYVSSTVLGHNWYYNSGEAYFDPSVGSSKLIFGSYGDMYFQNKAGAAAGFIQSIYVSPFGRVGIGSGFLYSSQPANALSVNGTASATFLVGNGAGVTNISPSNISNQNLLNAGSSLTASNVFVTNTTTNAVYYLTFVSSGSSTNIRTNAAGLSYNPSTNILNTGSISYVGGTLSTTAGGRVNLLSLYTNTGNSSYLEVSSVRNTNGSDWTTGAYRIQARVDSVYQAYVQFNGTGNDYGISFGTGLTNTTSNTYEKMRISSTGNVGIGTTNPLTKFVVSNGGAQGMEMGYSAGLSSNMIESYNRSTGLPVNMTYYIGSGGAEHIWYTNAINRMSITSGGYVKFNAEVYNKTTLAATRTLYIGSDYIIGGISSIRASKKNIESISDINWLYQLNTVTFNYRKKDKDDKYTEEVFEDLNYGLIAEDTEPIADFLINYDVRKDEKEMIGIEYSRLIVPILKAVQEQNIQIEELKLQVASLISNN